ncbi:odorant receptor 14 [Tribolium castaneum]|uniref:Odorant receptor 14 n=1 Tax=Tribolium castaneum TaxID=7070 RepID=D6WWX3_TRICA|nr:odorant receptor 14 [Tribolium castaneum]
MLLKWSSVIEFNLFLLKWIGLWPGEDYQLNMYSFYGFSVIILILCGHTLSTGLTLILDSGDIDTFTETMFILNIEFMTAWKALNFALNRKKFMQLLDAIDKTTFQPRNGKQVTLVLRNIDGWKVMFKMFGISLGLSFIFTGLLPIFSKTYKDRKLPMEAWYPFDSTKSPFYQLCYVYQMAAVAVAVMVILNVDTLVAAMNICIGLQCDLLCDNLRNLHTNTSKMQVFIYCWFGNEVIVKSSKIPYALFESDWTQDSLEMKKNMIVFILRTQKTLKITVCHVFDLSLPTFLTILKTGWSYFAFMNRVTSPH